MAAASAGYNAGAEMISTQLPTVDQNEIPDENKENESFAKSKPPPLEISTKQISNAGPVTPTSASLRTPKASHQDRERKIGHRRVDDEGQITYKKIQTSQIMCSIQLGISHSIGGLASKPERDLLMQDFAVIETTNFPNEGSSHTPAHRFTDFKFKAYAPVAFRYFRDLFGIQPDDFLLSMCNEPLRELTNPGASGSIFYLTQDDEFIIKTVMHKEGEFLQKLLAGYYMNLNQNPRTLLPKFFGLYCYQCGGKNVRLAVMNNLLPSSVKIHQKYDLKGSTYKRKASKYERNKPSPTYKDLDFMEHHTEGILLEAETYNALIKTIQRDCRVLESFKIMDYSLLVGIHNLDQAAREKMEMQNKAHEIAVSHATCTDGAGPSHGGLTRTKSMNRQKLVAHSTALEAIQAEVDPIDEDEDVPPGGIPARNAKGERLLLFLGIIDILQSYRLKKKLEHTWKAMLHDGDTVSVHRPGFYAQRFQDFMAKCVFKKIPSLWKPPLYTVSSKKKDPFEKTTTFDSIGLTQFCQGAFSQMVDLPEIKGPHRRFRALVSSYIALKHSPSRKKNSLRHRPSGATGIVPSEQRNIEDAASKHGLVGEPPEGTLTSSSSSRSHPAVLQNRKAGGLVKQRVPPPVPPRASRQRNKEPGPVAGRSDIPISSTPPPSFEEATRQGESIIKQRSNTDPATPATVDVIKPKPGPISVPQYSNSDKTDAVSISHITIKTDSTLSTQSIMSESSSTTSGFSSTIRTVTWTPPHSVEGSTPTHTEGTPSFTESSSSGDLGCPTTPIRGSLKDTGGAKSGEFVPYQETEM